MKNANLAKLALGFAVLLSSAANAAIITVTDNNFVSVDDSFNAKTLSFDAGAFTGSSIITDISLSVTFSKCGISVDTTGCIGGSATPYANEIGMAITNPLGTSVALIENDDGNELFETGNVETFQRGSSNLSLVTITFNDLASAFGTLPISGTFAPVGTLDSFLGTSAIGDWSFFFEDDVGGDPLGIHSVSLTIETESATNVSAPASLLIFGLGLSLLVLRRKVH